MALRALVAVFRPATGLIGRMRYAQKFVVVGLVLLVPLGFITVQYAGLERERIAFSVKEREGIALMAPLVTLMADAVQARHNGVGARAGRPIGVVPDLDRDIADVKVMMDRYGAGLDVPHEWESSYQLLQIARGARADAYAAFNLAITSLLDLVVHVGDRSNLTLDPNLDTYYLIDMLQFRLPVLLDAAGRGTDRPLVDKGADIDGALIDLGLNNGILTSTRDAMRRSVATIAANTSDKAVGLATQEQFDQLNDELDPLSILLTTAISGRRPAAVPVDAADGVHAHAASFAAGAASSLDRLLRSRIDRFIVREHRVEVIGGVAALLGAYLFVGFYLGVVPPIRRIVAGLQAVAAGDLTSEVAVDTHDELSFVVRTLNDTVVRTKVASDRLAVAATHDALTALPNRTMVLDRLDQALLRTRRTTRRTVVFFIDLDQFKIVNDSLGHDAGDQVLRAVARRLTDQVRKQDTVARLAGDEFVLISEDLQTVDTALAIAERLVAALSEPITVRVGSGERDVSIGASVGVAFADGSNDIDADGLLRDADVAMYRAKERGRGRVEIFDDTLRTALDRQMQTQSELRQAIDDEQLVVHYQPIVAIDTRTVVGFEALARWQHPERGLLLPADFIDVAERSGLIVSLGATILAQACAQVAAWRAASPESDLHVAVNVSAAQFSHPSFVPTVVSVLRMTGLEAGALWLEITETSIMADAGAAEDTLRAIRGLGVHLAIDDFGTGYSSLSYLRRFPVEALKVDRSFVDGLGRDKEDEAIVAMIVNLARSLDLVVVAEGVETADQLAHLERLGCEQVQGYYLRPPMPAGQAWPADAAAVIAPLPDPALAPTPAQ